MGFQLAPWRGRTLQVNTNVTIAKWLIQPYYCVPVMGFQLECRKKFQEPGQDISEDNPKILTTQRNEIYIDSLSLWRGSPLYNAFQDYLYPHDIYMGNKFIFIFFWLTHLWSPLTWWVCFLFCTLAQAQAPHRAQKVSTGLPRLYRGLYSAVLDLPELNHSVSNFRGSAIDYHWSCFTYF